MNVQRATRRKRIAALAATTTVAAGCTLLNPLEHYQAEKDTALPGDAAVAATEDVRVDSPTAVVDADSPETGVPPPCDLSQPFGAPVFVTELNSAKTDTVSDLAFDGLTIYLSSNRVGPGLGLFSATRAARNLPWTAPKPLFPANTDFDWSIAVSFDALTAIVCSSRPGAGTLGGNDLFVSTRNSTFAPFGPLAPVAAANSTANDESPRWAPDGKTLYFDSERSGSRWLYRSPVVGSTFSDPQPVAELNTSSFNGVPVLTKDELEIYFSSNRSPTTDKGDIYVATRARKSDAFGNIKLAPNLNSAGLDAPGPISGDGCVMYLSSIRGGGGAGEFHIYSAERPR